MGIASLVALAPAARAEGAPPAPAPPAAQADDTDKKPPRPPLPPLPEAKPVPWEEHAEIGGGVAFAEVLSTQAGDGKPTPVRLRPGVGGHVRLAWHLLRYLDFTGYMVEADHPLTMPSGSIGIPGSFANASAHSYFFGGRLSPTLPIGDRVRLWATVGGGWGLVAYPDLTVTAPGGSPFTIRGRTSTIVEIPLGLGASFEIVPRWLRIYAELTGSFYPSQIGAALEIGQAVDDTGRIRNVGPMPHLDGGFTQTIGLSLLL
jgi:hypothetical protein